MRDVLEIFTEIFRQAIKIKEKLGVTPTTPRIVFTIDDIPLSFHEKFKINSILLSCVLPNDIRKSFIR